jgi:hypothetical protein
MKPIWKSRMVLFNLAGLIAGILEALVDVVPADWQPYVVAAFTIINMILRFDTTKPVSFRAQK